MSDATYEMSELRDLLNHETVERHRLEAEVIGLGPKIDTVSRDLTNLSGRFNTFAEVVLARLDQMANHLGVRE